MRDKRPVDELSIEELERILAIRKREERMQRFRQQQNNDRVMAVPLPEDKKAVAAPESSVALERIEPQQHEAALGVQSPDYPETYDITEDMPHFEDEDFEAVKFVEPMRQSQGTRRKLDRHNGNAAPVVGKRVNKLLLAVEAAAVVGLIVILVLGFIGLSEIQKESDQVQQELANVLNSSRITPTPLPILTAGETLLLPGGHAPLDDSGDNFYQELELAFDVHNVPQNQRSALRRQIAPPQTANREIRGSDPQFIDLPTIGKRNLSIVGGTDWETLKAGVGWFNNGAQPGTDLNVVLSAHNDIYGSVFREITELQIGDEVTLLDANSQRYTYRVVDGYEVEPTEVSVLDPNAGGGQGILTLITCYPYGENTHRWIVVAELVE